MGISKECCTVMPKDPSIMTATLMLAHTIIVAVYLLLEATAPVPLLRTSAAYDSSVGPTFPVMYSSKFWRWVVDIQSFRIGRVTEPVDVIYTIL